MPKWRRLHAKIVESEDFNDMPDDFTRLVWVLLPLAMDKEGRSIDNAALIRSRIMPMREDVTTEDMRRALDWFEQRGMIVRYEVNGRRYFYIPTWHKYQNTAREAESEYPEPPMSEDDTTHEEVASNSRVTHEQVAKKSALDIDVDIEVDVEVEDQRANARRADAPAPPPAPPAPVSENLAEQARKPPERAQNPPARAPDGPESRTEVPKVRAKRGESAPDGRSSRARPELSAIISEFVDWSGISPPANKRELRSWYSAAQEMLSEFGTSDDPKNPGPVLYLMRKFFEAREKGEEWAQFTISSPRSLMKTMRALRAGQVRTRASPGARKPKRGVYERNMEVLKQVLAEEGT